MEDIYRTMSGKPWTNKQKEVLKDLYIQKDLPYKKIAKLMNRTEPSIRTRVWLEGWSKRKQPENLGKGLNKKKFRSPRVWKVKNRILYGLLWVEDIKLSQLADMVNVNPRTVQNWIYKGIIPNEENTKKICDILKIPEYILFGKYAFKNNKSIQKEP